MNFVILFMLFEFFGDWSSYLNTASSSVEQNITLFKRVHSIPDEWIQHGRVFIIMYR